MLLAVDPGIRGCGVALFNTDLVEAGYVKNSIGEGNKAAECYSMARAVKKWLCNTTIHTLVLEWPQMYRPGLGRGDPNDLFGLAGVDCAIQALLQPIQTVCYLPREWKGQLPKEICIRRVKNKLKDAELLAFKERNHNVWDAVGIGLFYLGRF